MVMKEIEKLSPKAEFLRQFEVTYKDEFLPADWSQEKKDRVVAETSPGKIKSLMFTSIPMECRASDCIFAPKGHPCPYEVGMVSNFMSDYIEQLNIDLDNLIELSQVRTLVNQEVQYVRATKLLAKEDFIQENVVGIDPDGDPIFQKQLHLAIDYEDKILKRQQTFFKSFLATREAAAKASVAQLDSSQTMSGLIASVFDIRDKREKDLKQRLGIVDHDDYIDIPVKELEPGEE
jgi:hypothetical protein